MPGRPFVVHVAKLRRVSGTRWHEVRRGILDGLACSGTSVPEGTEVEVDVTLESVAGGVSVSGTVRSSWSGECRRCLAPASGPVLVRVLEHYTEGGDGSDTYPLHDDEVDLEIMARDAVLLELPQAPLCAPECRGLCPSCGANLNEETCTCEAAPADPRWAALAALRFGEGPDERPGGE